MRFLAVIMLALVFSFTNAAEISRSFDCRNTSSIKAEDLNKHFKGVLTGTGKSFKEAEKKYKVNALFLAAIAIFESTNGTSNKAKRRRNCFGLKRKTFKSIEDCIDYTAMILASPNGHYYGRKKYTVEKIGRTYAPTWDNPSNKHWIPSVVSIMKKLQKSQQPAL